MNAFSKKCTFYIGVLMKNNPNSLLYNLACQYWGSPNIAFSNEKEIRFGKHGSKSINVSLNIWYDHENKIGGGITSLISTYDKDVNLDKKIQQFNIENEIKNFSNVWTYVNENNEPMYQIIRSHKDGKKKYYQRHFADDNKFVWGMKNIIPLPYNLPQILKSKDTIFVVEGEKCSEALINLGLIATTNHGGANKWPKILNSYFENKNIVIIPDNDEIGLKHAQLVAANLFNIATTIKILKLPNLPPKGDVCDWIDMGGNKEKLITLANNEAYTTPELVNTLFDQNQSKKFEFIKWSELIDAPIKWIIDDILPCEGLAILYGQPGVGKSFIAMDIAAAISSGLTFFNKKVKKGNVIYIASEGHSGLVSRRNAIQKYRQIDLPNVYLLKSQLDLRSNDNDCLNFIETVKKLSINPTLIIIDTLSRSFGGGNENSSEDMGNFISYITKIQNILHTTILIIHHSGKDESRGARGHSSLHAAIDTQFEVQKLSNINDAIRKGQLTITKQKDGDDGIKLFFKLDIIQIDASNISNKSLVVTPIENNDTPSNNYSNKLIGHDKRAFDAISRAIQDCGEIRILIAPNHQTIPIEKWKEYFLNAMDNNTSKINSKLKSFSRSYKNLIDKGLVSESSEYVWIS